MSKITPVTDLFADKEKNKKSEVIKYYESYSVKEILIILQKFKAKTTTNKRAKNK